MDTVELNGAGFEVLVEAGQNVKAGEPLVKVDLQTVQKAGKSLVSPVIITSGQAVGEVKPGMVKAGEPAPKIEK